MTPGEWARVFDAGARATAGPVRPAWDDGPLPADMLGDALRAMRDECRAIDAEHRADRRPIWAGGVDAEARRPLSYADEMISRLPIDGVSSPPEPIRTPRLP